MSDDTALSIAKELTLAVLPRVSAPGNSTPEFVGKHYGKLFEAVLVSVVKGINEANKPE